MAVTNTPDKSELKANPERIWLQPSCCASPYEGRLWCEDKAFDDCEDGNAPTEYVRADLSRPPADHVPDMVERVARAMFDDELADTPRRDPEQAWEQERLIWLKNAKAAIAALQAVPAASEVGWRNRCEHLLACIDYSNEAGAPPDELDPEDIALIGETRAALKASGEE